MERRWFGKTLSITNQTTNASENTLAFEVNVVSSDKGKNQKQPGGKKKGKNKKKQDNSTKEKSSDSSTSARKPRYPCLICNDDHFTRDCPHCSKVSNLLKTSNTSAIFTDPFPKSKAHLVVTDHASTSQVLILSITKPQNEVLVSMRKKDYGNPSSSSNDQATDQPNPLTSISSKVVPPIVPELTIKPPKGVVHKSTFNP